MLKRMLIHSLVAAAIVAALGAACQAAGPGWSGTAAGHHD